MTVHNSQINITLGTAGHIDHGKTALIKLLTGCETDRLRQEKERGMSIELGFAPCKLGDLEVGIVDVPGHENFVKTMVAGAAGIDGVIFVVAADDSIMPQTREHFDILTLLGVQHGIVALTKIDIVTTERVQAVQDELKQYLKGTFLEDSPVCPVSSITGDGFDGFYKALKNMTEQIQPRNTDGIFRLPVERTFLVKGFGAVASGIPSCGSAKVGDDVVLLPQGQKSRIKAIQVYGQDSDTVQSGQCAALNLPQIDYKTVQRGNVLTQGEYFKPAGWFLCSLKLLNLDALRIKNGTKLKFHTGTSETTAAVYLIEDDALQAGCETIIQIRTDQSIVAGPNDRFILRGLSPVRTLGGGHVIEAMEHKIKRTKEGVQEDLRDRMEAVCNPLSFAEYAIRHASGFAATVNEIAYRMKLPPQQVQALIEQLIEQETVLKLTSDLYIHVQTNIPMQDVLIQQVQQYHKANPDRPGIEREDLLEKSRLQKKVFDGLLKLLLSDNKFILRKDRIALPAYREQFDLKTQTLLNRIEAIYAERLFCPPKAEELAADLHREIDDINRTIRILTEQQILARVDRGLYFHTTAIQDAKQRIIEHVRGDGEGRLESVRFKYLLDTTRKYAIPLLDYMDKIGFTCRIGNTRHLK